MEEGKAFELNLLVLVEIRAKKGFKSEVAIQYTDKDKNVKGGKKVKVEYDWKPPDIAVENKKKEEEEFTLDTSKVWQQKNQGSKKVAEGNSGKLQPSFCETKNWTQEMRDYFKRAWAADREKEKNDLMEGIVEDVIVVGWNTDVVRLMVINESKQHMLCLIENIHDHRKLYCSFVYALNSGTERRDLWNELQIAKVCTNGIPWILMGDFNVTLSLSEHKKKLELWQMINS
nr:RNA-directed DNA polymerase, eukaryota, reverse transcriptase zinc-binding domain protein [Tanacetum cinerariifolium]